LTPRRSGAQTDAGFAKEPFNRAANPRRRTLPATRQVSARRDRRASGIRPNKLNRDPDAKRRCHTRERCHVPAGFGQDIEAGPHPRPL
jgi:hypothetical protein